MKEHLFDFMKDLMKFSHEFKNKRDGADVPPMGYMLFTSYIRPGCIIYEDVDISVCFENASTRSNIPLLFETSYALCKARAPEMTLLGVVVVSEMWMSEVAYGKETTVEEAIEATRHLRPSNDPNRIEVVYIAASTIDENFNLTSRIIKKGNVIEFEQMGEGFQASETVEMFGTDSLFPKIAKIKP